jgi:hypothetical protein
VFRSLYRVEVRCSNIENLESYWRSFAYPSRGNYDRLQPWPRARRLDELRADLARARAASPPDRLALFDALVAVAQPGEVGPAETEVYLVEALAIAHQPGAGAQIEPLRKAIIVVNLAHIEQIRRPRGRVVALDADTMLAHPLISSDPRATAAMRFLLAREDYVGERDIAAAEQLSRLFAMPPSAIDPIVRTEALELQAAIRAAQGDAAAARAAMGPGARRCGTPPRRLRIVARSADFPTDAMRWGFEGWATTDVSVAADGSVADARRIMVYPAFVFGEAAEQVVRRSRYAPISTADGRPCTLHITTVNFRMPR